MERSIYSGEVFLTGNVTVIVTKARNGRPVKNRKVRLESCGFT